MAHSDAAKWTAQKHKENTSKVISTLTKMFAKHPDARLLQAKNLMESYKRDNQFSKPKM